VISTQSGVVFLFINNSIEVQSDFISAQTTELELYFQCSFFVNQPQLKESIVFLLFENRWNSHGVSNRVTYQQHYCSRVIFQAMNIARMFSFVSTCCLCVQKIWQCWNSW